MEENYLTLSPLIKANSDQDEPQVVTFQPTLDSSASFHSDGGSSVLSNIDGNNLPSIVVRFQHFLGNVTFFFFLCISNTTFQA